MSDTDNQPRQSASDMAAEIRRLRSLNAELVATLTDIRSATNADDPESYRADDREGCLDTVFAIADRALSRATKEPGNG